MSPADPTAPQPPADRPGDPAEELIDIVDAQDRVVGQARRGEAYARGLRHRCVFVQVRDADGRIFVHRRTPTKLVFPSLYDMFVGGVVGAGESYDDAALREAEEELGVTGLPRPRPLVKFLYGPDPAAAGATWWSFIYEVRCTLPVRPQATEVAWHAFLPEDEVERRLHTWPWVPDGLAAYRRLQRFRAAAAGGPPGPRPPPDPLDGGGEQAAPGRPAGPPDDALDGIPTGRHDGTGTGPARARPGAPPPGGR